MSRRIIGLAGGIACAFIVCAAAVALEADFEISTYNPSVGEVVNLAVCESCLGSATGLVYAWDFDGDGITDLETTEALVTHAFAADGFFEVVLKVSGAGQTGTCRRAVLVGPSPAIAVREALLERDGAILVLLTIDVRDEITGGIGLTERMQTGWQLEVVDAGGAATKVNSEAKALEIVWPMALASRDRLTFSYRLYPGYASSLQKLEGELSGYTGGVRFKGGICGDLGLPQ